MNKTTISYQGVLEIFPEENKSTGVMIIETTTNGQSKKKKHEFFFEPGTDLKAIGQRIIDVLFVD